MNAPTTANATSRYPVRRRLDGDFDLPNIASPNAAALPQPTISSDFPDAALAARIWEFGRAGHGVIRGLAGNSSPGRSSLTRHEQPSAADEALLHAVETAPLWRPPVADTTSTLGPLLPAWLRLADHWISLAEHDLRYLNAACKLLGACFLHTHPPAATPPSTGARQHHQYATGVAQRLQIASQRLLTDLTRRVPRGAPDPPRTTAVARSGWTGASPPRVLVLAGAQSVTADRFLTAAECGGLPITAVCWYCPPEESGPDSSYAEAWYPPPSAPSPAPTPITRPSAPSHHARDWQSVGQLFHRHKPDLVLLIGMPIVPAPILDQARIGVINAHNGALPHYRGMDAVAWTLLNGDTPTCTLHHARPRVDAGEVIATSPVSALPLPTLRARIKEAQLDLLLAATAFTLNAGRLPDATAQNADNAKQYYRLHPHLKRLLDASPYGATPSSASPSEPR